MNDSVSGRGREESSSIRLLSIAHAEQIVDRAENDENYDFMASVGEAVLKAHTLVGVADQYHNLAVPFTRNGDYRTGYEIILKGLEVYPYDVDLLADAVYYGSSCDRIDECWGHIQTLNSRPRSLWNWRSFSFVIDFYLGMPQWCEEVDEILKGAIVALELVGEYRRYLQYEEKAYLSEHKVHVLLESLYLGRAVEEQEPNKREELLSESKKQGEAAEQVLKDAVGRDDLFAAQCGLKYADYLIERCRYSEAAEVCKKVLAFGETQPSISVEYLIYVNAIALDGMLADDGAYGDHARIAEVFDAYRVAWQRNENGRFRRNILDRLAVIQSRSGIDAPEMQDSSTSMLSLRKMLESVS